MAEYLQKEATRVAVAKDEAKAREGKDKGNPEAEFMSDDDNVPIQQLATRAVVSQSLNRQGSPRHIEVRVAGERRLFLYDCGNIELHSNDGLYNGHAKLRRECILLAIPDAWEVESCVLAAPLTQKSK